MSLYTVTTDAVLVLDGRKVAEFVLQATAETTAALLNAHRAESLHFARVA